MERYYCDSFKHLHKSKRGQMRAFPVEDFFNDDNSSLSVTWTMIFGPTVHLCPGNIVISKAAGTQLILQHSALQ